MAHINFNSIPPCRYVLQEGLDQTSVKSLWEQFKREHERRFYKIGHVVSNKVKYNDTDRDEVQFEYNVFKDETDQENKEREIHENCMCRYSFGVPLIRDPKTNNLVPEADPMIYLNQRLTADHLDTKDCHFVPAVVRCWTKELIYDHYEILVLKTPATNTRTHTSTSRLLNICQPLINQFAAYFKW